MTIARFTITGRPCSWKNNKRPVRAGNYAKIVAKEGAKKWMSSAVMQLKAQWLGKQTIPKDVPLWLIVTSYLPTRGKIDLDNLYGGPQDAMQTAGIIQDDSAIESHDGSRRLYDKDNPRVELELRRYDERT